MTLQDQFAAVFGSVPANVAAMNAGLTEEDQTAFRHVDNLLRMPHITERRQYLSDVEGSAGYAMRAKVERIFKYRWETKQAELQAIRERA